MKKRRKLLLNRFAVQLPLLFFTAGFAVILIFCGVIYFAVSRVLLSETIDHTKSMLEMSSVNMETYIDRLWSESTLFASDPDLKEYLSSSGSTRGAQLERRIALMLATDPYIKSIVAVSKDGRILSNETDLDMSVSEDMMQEKWYIDAIHADMPVLTSARMQSFSADKDNWVISVSTEVTDYYGENAGVLVVDMQYGVIETLLQNLNLGQEGYVFLLNGDNEPVYHWDTAFFSDAARQEELVALAAQGSRYDPLNNLLVARTQVENADWTMVAVVYLDNLHVLRRHLFETVVLTGVLLLAVMLVVGTLFTQRLTKPIRKLERNMLQIEKLAEIEPDRHTFYELKVFSDHYNHMIGRIRKLLDELSRKEEQQRSLELQALTDQINPHFLYNTLDTIVWMAEFNDSAKVVALTKSLAVFFRISLSGGRAIITVGEELEHVSQYLFIQKERYEDKLTYSVTAEEDVLSCLVPKLILQPIAENSIYHGIKKLSRPGHIQITAVRAGGQVCLTVSDDGAGFDPLCAAHVGVGLSNVRERIALYYGACGGVALSSQPGKGCTVQVTVPAEGPTKSGPTE